MLKPLSPPPHTVQIYLRQTIFFPQVENEVKGDVAEIQEAVTDELKKVQKDEFSAAFQKLYGREKACSYANGAYFELKKVLSSSCAFVFLNQS
jgi:hypothetical protein